MNGSMTCDAGTSTSSQILRCDSLKALGVLSRYASAVGAAWKVLLDRRSFPAKSELAYLAGSEASFESNMWAVVQGSATSMLASRATERNQLRSTMLLDEECASNAARDQPSVRHGQCGPFTLTLLAAQSLPSNDMVASLPVVEGVMQPIVLG